MSGHRRYHAAEQAGLEAIPVIAWEVNGDEAIIAMVDSDLQRDAILSSERAWAYKMKMNAVKYRGARTDSSALLYSGQ
ncbi:MAG: hypothetical protein LUC30_09505 [Clostridiales bacterium]|nr:hypothetical protein [Clostridiales bacterium]